VAIFDLAHENPQEAARQIGASGFVVDVTSRESLDAAFAGEVLRVYTVDGTFIAPDEARERPLDGPADLQADCLGQRSG